MHRAPYAYPTGHRRHTPLPIPTADRRRLTLGSGSPALRFAVVAQQDVANSSVEPNFPELRTETVRKGVRATLRL